MEVSGHLWMSQGYFHEDQEVFFLSEGSSCLLNLYASATASSKLMSAQKNNIVWWAPLSFALAFLIFFSYLLGVVPVYPPVSHFESFGFEMMYSIMCQYKVIANYTGATSLFILPHVFVRYVIVNCFECLLVVCGFVISLLYFAASFRFIFEYIMLNSFQQYSWWLASRSYRSCPLIVLTTSPSKSSSSYLQ